MDFVKIANKESSEYEDSKEKAIYQTGFLNGVICTQSEAIDAFERVYDKFLGKQDEPYWINLKFKIADEIRKDMSLRK